VQLFQPRPVGRLARQRDLCLRPEEENRVAEMARVLNEDPDAPLVVAYPAVEDPGMLGCCGGYARVHIDSWGHVCPCDFAPLSFGRVTQEPFVKIWERMRSFFAEPSDRCLVRDNPDVFDGEREERNVMFSDLSDPERLRGSRPGVYRRLGEGAYRLLASGLTLASVAADHWGGDKN
jgi:MoaA/NifB/PqqE/SkfB family radical SAM enzyme